MKYYAFFLLIFLLPFLQFCKKETPEYKALQAKYVGKEVCMSCHADVWKTFQHTGMGRSFGKATRKKSSAIFGEHIVIYDSVGKFHYKPFWEKDTLKVLEFRLKDKDTIHKLIFPVHYIIGSGQHTNSHLYQVNGYLFQVPATFYTQKKIWDLPPGFENNNTRFFRKIGIECMSCHNAMPEFDFTSENKFLKIPEGIDCERCHGPGSEHVKEKQSGKLADTTKFVDYSIVNPGDLSREKQMSICMRCHLQGVTVLAEGKKFTDFVPSEHLNDYLWTFVPDYKDARTFWMASHVERLMQSACYRNSEMSCITCHNPHVSVKETKNFNAKCSSCHSVRHYDENCVNCHMPKSESIDIPHVAITDHKIGIHKEKTRKDVASSYVLPSELRYVGLRKPAKNEILKAYLKYFDAFKAPSQTLENARKYLDAETPLKEKIYFYYLREDYDKIIAEIRRNKEVKNLDAWTFYRIGEAYFQKQRYEKAEEFLRKAVAEQTYNLDFRRKLAMFLLTRKQLREAREELEYILSENPYDYEACFLLGVLEELQGNEDKAKKCYKKTLHLHPDHTEAVINLAKLLIRQERKSEARKVLENFLYFNENKEARLLLEVL